MDLFGTADDDVVTIRGGNTAYQIKDGTDHLSETVVTPAPTFFEAGLGGDTLAKLMDNSPTTLSGVATAGPGDATWAFEWDYVVANNGSLLISKDKRLEMAPEPATLGLLAFGLLAALKRRRQNKKSC